MPEEENKDIEAEKQGEQIDPQGIAKGMLIDGKKADEVHEVTGLLKRTIGGMKGVFACVRKIPPKRELKKREQHEGYEAEDLTKQVDFPSVMVNGIAYAMALLCFVLGLTLRIRIFLLYRAFFPISYSNYLPNL